MRVRIIIGGGLALAATLSAGIPALAATSSSSVPPACVVVNGPSGVSVQAGYAPNGPSDCTTLP